MSAQSIIQTLQKLTALYKSVNVLAKHKTEMIKTGNIQELNAVIADEKKHILALQKIEKDLLKKAKDYLIQLGVETNSITLSLCIEQSPKTDRISMEKIKVDLEKEIKTLKQKNELNQQLLEQSLQFVNLSLDLLSPNMDSFNYDRPNTVQEYSDDKRSIFDSKA
ncbi:flagellar protein FlgN [Bacillus dakarensis]|uniref:flagellar protein FlgN n=1 Tax=Robertmurraya dakarensis TaxID=1926278 RepID=UPI0009823245|nr:flagellar protein FlgN [Bacillus dakarensis]